MFFFDLEINSSSPEGAFFYRPDIPGSEPGRSELEKVFFLVEIEFFSISKQNKI